MLYLGNGFGGSPHSGVNATEREVHFWQTVIESLGLLCGSQGFLSPSSIVRLIPHPMVSIS